MRFFLLCLTLGIAFSRPQLQGELSENQNGGGDDMEVKNCPALHLGANVTVDPPTCSNGAQPRGRRCSFACDKGYRIKGPPHSVCQDDGSWAFGHNQINCIDIDECELKKGGCSHECHNYPGGYHCECPRPLILDKDGKTCRAVGLVLNCTAHNIEIIIPKYALNDLQGDYLQLRDHTCHPRENKTHYIFKTELNGCGTTRRHTKNVLVYSNRVSERKVAHNGIITRVGDDEFNIPFCCYYLDNAIVGAVGYKPFVRELVLKEKGYGQFKLRMDFYHFMAYKTLYTWGDFPVSVYLRQRLYFEVSVDSIDKDLVVFAGNCCATPTRDHEKAGRLRHELIHEGCVVDSTTQKEISPSPHKQRFSVEAFKFVGNMQFVYLHCSVIVCKAGDPNSRCAKGCVPGLHRGKPMNGPYPQHIKSHVKIKADDTRTRHTRAVQKHVEKRKKDHKYLLSKGPVSLIEDEPKVVRALDHDKKVIDDQSLEDHEETKVERKRNDLEVGMQKDVETDKTSVAASASNILLIVLTALTVVALVGVLYIGRRVRQATNRGLPNYRPMRS